MSLVCVAQPLEGADGHGSVEGTRPEWHPISHVTQHQVTLHLSLLCNACYKRILSCHCQEIVLEGIWLFSLGLLGYYTAFTSDPEQFF